jgi:LuxR family transcriptional regulator, maltose regulon positive regulatory protein
MSKVKPEILLKDQAHPGRLDDIDPFPLLATKLYCPPISSDLIPRSRLLERLERNRTRPLTLISAPAGYGKSVLASMWLQTCNCPNAWISLDEGDDDLSTFLSYLLAAISAAFPTLSLKTRLLLNAPNIPGATVVARYLLNDLEQVETNFIMALDDLHRIKAQAIYDFLTELLKYPSPVMHLLLISRQDPPLSIVSLRASRKVNEIRALDLRFTQEETQQLFQEMIGASVDPREINKMNAQAEGWVTGLRLAALALRHRIGANDIQSELSARNRYVSEYLFNEILERQAATLSNCLLKTSILNRFCADLCEVMCFSDEKHASTPSLQSDFSGESFLEWLQVSNLFVISLDDQSEWFRYHHLFQDFLQNQLDRRFSPEEVRKLHSIAGRWFADNNLIDEAFYHLLSAGEISQAIELVAQHRYEMLNQARWLRLENWLNLFQGKIIETSAELWMLKTLLVYHRGRWNELPAMLDRLEAILADDPDQKKASRLQGEFLALSSLLAYFSGVPERALSQARMALELTPPEFWSLRVFARLYVGLSLQMLGDETSAQQALYRAFEEEQSKNEYLKANVLMMVCFIHWIAADLQRMEQAAKQSAAICQEIANRQILGYSQTLLGFVRYQQNDLPAAGELFAAVVSKPYLNYGNSYLNSVCGLAMTYQALGKSAEARKIIESAIAFLLETANTTQLPNVRALQAEVALQQGNLSAASQWAEKLDPIPPFTSNWGFFAPHLTLVRIWLVQNTLESRAKAANLVNRIQEYYENTHNTRFLIEALALKTLLEDANGGPSAAFEALEKALRLAQPGGFIRVFVDAGPEMARLLTQIEVDNSLHDYVLQIRSAFPEFQQTQKTLKNGELLQPLTNRELQILKLLREHLTNKEIAAQLVISPGTVKSHTIRLYQKLDVNGRRQAVEKAIKLGILAPQ